MFLARNTVIITAKRQYRHQFRLKKIGVTYVNFWNNNRSFIITNNDRRTNSPHYLLGEDSNLSPELNTFFM